MLPSSSPATIRASSPATIRGTAFDDLVNVSASGLHPVSHIRWRVSGMRSLCLLSTRSSSSLMA
eukprot:1612920-Rhodomonas_salina.1